jgi:WD40 repeat protein
MYGEGFVANNKGEIKLVNKKGIKLIKKEDNRSITNLAFLNQKYKYLVATNQDTIMIYNIKNKDYKKVFNRQLSNFNIKKIITVKDSSKIYYFTNDYGYKYMRYALAYIDPTVTKNQIDIVYKNDTIIADAIINDKSNIIAIADYNGNIKIIDQKSYKLKYTLSIGKKNRTKIAIDKEVKYLLAIYDEKDIVIWDLETKKIKYKIDNYGLNITDFKISRDAVKIAFDDGSIRWFDTKDGKYLARLYPFENKQSIFIYQDGTYKATKDIDKYCDISVEPYDKYFKFTNNKPRSKATVYKGYDLSKIDLIPLDILKELDDNGFKLDLDKWYKKRTPLHDAISRNDYKRVKWLLNHGANTVLRDGSHDPSPWRYFDYTKENTKIYKLLENKPFAQVDRYNGAFCQKFVEELYDKNYQKYCKEAVVIYKKKIDIQSIKFIFLAGDYKKILKLSIDPKKYYQKWVKEHYWKYLGYSYYIQGDYQKTKECFKKLLELKYKTKKEYKEYLLKDTILIQKLYDKDSDKLNGIIKEL